MEKNMYRDFDRFSRSLVESNDVDPVYPFIKDLLKHKKNYQPEFFVFVYVAFYSLETAIQFCDLWPTYNDFDARGRKTFLGMRINKELNKFGHERRGSCRNPHNQLKLFKAVGDFINTELKGLKSQDNKTFRDVLGSYPWHGSWASFKVAEIFEKSLGWSNLRIEDLGIDERDPNSNDGPVGGLRWLFGRDNNYDKKWFPIWNRFGEELAKAWDFDIGEVETCLCKFHKFVSGKYYIGHDIQEFVELEHVLSKEVYWEIMAGNFDKKYWKGVIGVEKKSKGLYLRTGKILNEIPMHIHGTKTPSIDVEDIILNL